MSKDAECIIKSINAREILDSRGYPTVEAKVCTTSGISGTASTPSGASTGKHEALELRDADNIKRFLGKGALKAVTNVNEKIASILVGRCCNNQEEVDKLMIEADGTENMSVLGANATTAVSIACAKAAANTRGWQLYQYISEVFSSTNKQTKSALSTPVPLMNIVNGGKHAGNDLAIQEFMIAPVGARDFSEAVRMGCEIYQELKSLLSVNLGKAAINVGDEGGFAPTTIRSTESVLSYISDAIDRCGYTGSDIVFGIDCAASNFWNLAKTHYTIDGKQLDSDELLDYYCSLCDQYPIRLIEDPFREDDLESFVKITAKLGDKICVVGDDIFVTNKTRVQEGIELGAANSIIIKINQIGTLTRALEALRPAKSKLWRIIASHRSGETSDDWLADFSVGIGADAIKAGGPARGERVVKYNRLMQIEQMKTDASVPKIAFKSNGLLKNVP